MKKWILVTGGTRGIGKSVVEVLCEKGYDVVFTYETSQEAAAALEQMIADKATDAANVASTGMASSYRCNAADAASVQLFSQKILQERGAPFAIVNNAGITRDAAMMNMSASQWLDVIGVNLNSAFFMIQPFLGAMIENGDGVILQMSSVSGLKGSAGQTNYSATKAALSGMTRSLAIELGRFNIRVNAIAPGYIKTDMTDGMSEKESKSIKQQIPLRRLGTVREISGLVGFMLSDEGAYITGQTFVVDGGLSA